MAMINDGDDILDDGSATILVTFRGGGLKECGDRGG